jgi:hypothetical protein
MTRRNTLKGFMGEPYDQDPHPGRNHMFDGTGRCFCGAETSDTRDRRLIGYAVKRMSEEGVSDRDFWVDAASIAMMYINYARRRML